MPVQTAPADPATLDRLYNNRALVPDHADYFTRWAECSAGARRLQMCELDLPYGDGPLETLDIFPTDRPDAPVLVFIHGGYWRSLDKSDHSFLAPVFTRAGAHVVVPNYALCPSITIPGIVMQMVRALRWTWRHAHQWGGDPSRIHVVGHSAGGHLAAMMLACRWSAFDDALPADLVKSALSISGLYDLRPLARTPFLQADLRLTEADARLASPALMPAPASGVLYSVAGGDESAEFIRHNRLIRQAWGPMRVPVCEELPGRNHFSVLEALSDRDHRLHALACRLLGV